MKAKPLVGRVAQFNDILHHLELMENIENLVYANSRFYSFLCSFRLMVLSGKKYGSKDGVIQSIEFMRENISNVISLEDLAEVAGLSVSHYCAMFQTKNDADTDAIVYIHENTTSMSIVTKQKSNDQINLL